MIAGDSLPGRRVRQLVRLTDERHSRRVRGVLGDEGRRFERVQRPRPVFESDLVTQDGNASCSATGVDHRLTVSPDFFQTVINARRLGVEKVAVDTDGETDGRARTPSLVPPHRLPAVRRRRRPCEGPPVYVVRPSRPPGIVLSAYPVSTRCFPTQEEARCSSCGAPFCRYLMRAAPPLADCSLNRLARSPPHFSRQRLLPRFRATSRRTSGTGFSRVPPACPRPLGAGPRGRSKVTRYGIVVSADTCY